MEVESHNFIAGHTSSCSCLHQEMMSARLGEKNSNFKHGRSRNSDPTYGSWASMVLRVTQPSHPGYRNYGGAGVKICERWLGEHGFENFLADIGNRPSPKYSLSRHLDSGDYKPGNVEWGTKTEQTAEHYGKKA